MGTSLWDFVANFGLWKISPRQVNRVVNKNRSRSSLLTTLRKTVDASWLFSVYCTSVNRNPLTPLLQSVVDLLYNLGIGGRNFDWHSASRGPSATAELLVV